MCLDRAVRTEFTSTFQDLVLEITSISSSPLIAMGATPLDGGEILLVRTNIQLKLENEDLSLPKQLTMESVIAGPGISVLAKCKD